MEVLYTLFAIAPIVVPLGVLLVLLWLARLGRPPVHHESHKRVRSTVTEAIPRERELAARARAQQRAGRHLTLVLLLALAVPVGARAPAASAVAPRVHADPAPGRGAVKAVAAQLGATPTPSETLPSRWCGDAIAGDDEVNAYDNGAYRFHGVYFVPSDRPSRLPELGSRFQADAVHASALIERARGRALRFDMGNRCGPGYLDITTVRLAEDSRQLEQLAEAPIGMYRAATAALTRALPASFAGSAGLTTNYIGWLDGPAPAGVCGQAALVDDSRRSAANLNNGGGKLALVYRQGETFCDGDVIRHEVAHTLGVAATGAPHLTGAGHVTDALEDTLAEAGAPRVGAGDAFGEFVDYGSDDYWGELPWWTLDLSRYLCRTTGCNVAQSQPGAAPTAATAKKPPTIRRGCRRRHANRGRRVARCRSVAPARRPRSA